jgi:hypothetical protein
VLWAPREHTGSRPNRDGIEPSWSLSRYFDGGCYQLNGRDPASEASEDGAGAVVLRGCRPMHTNPPCLPAADTECSLFAHTNTGQLYEASCMNTELRGLNSFWVQINRLEAFYPPQNLQNVFNKIDRVDFRFAFLQSPLPVARL